MRCPSRRREMSSISQMERSSSQTRMLATGPSRGADQHASLFDGVVVGNGLGVIEAMQSQDEGGSLPGLGTRPNLSTMSLYDLVDDGQPQPGATFELGLERLEDFFDLLRAHAGPGVGKADLPIVPERFDRDGEFAAALDAFHGANGILTEIPKYLFELVPVGKGESVADGKPALDGDPGFLGRHAVVHERQGIFDELDEVDPVEMILLSARVGQEVGNDAVQALRLAGHNVEQAAMVLIHLGDAGKHADRTGDGSEGITDFMRDGSSQ